MNSLFASGRIADLILCLMVIEALFVWRIARSRPAFFADMAPTLLSGACLALALRGALIEAWWGWIALALTFGLFAHVADLVRRLVVPRSGV